MKSLVFAPHTLFNVYPNEHKWLRQTRIIHPVKWVWVMGSDLGEGGEDPDIGPLPEDWFLLDAEIIGNRTGTRFVADITPIDDLANLPSMTDDNTEITWDLSRFSQTTGNFFLAEATLPFEEMVVIPEPTSFAIWSLLVTTGVGAVWWQRRRLSRI